MSKSFLMGAGIEKKAFTRSVCLEEGILASSPSPIRSAWLVPADSEDGIVKQFANGQMFALTLLDLAWSGRVDAHELGFCR